MTSTITPDLLLKAYAAGIFPMAEDGDDPHLFWLEPKQRGVLPLDNFHIPRRLARTVRADCFTIKVDTDFEGVIAGCAAAYPDRPRTWINSTIRQLYGELFDLGFCHSVEAYAGDKLVGGLYGVHLGAAFFGESMFHIERDASKVALVHLAARLRRGGFHLLDAQFVTDHLSQFGAQELSRSLYRKRLDEAVNTPANWWCWPKDQRITGAEALKVLA